MILTERKIRMFGVLRNFADDEGFHSISFEAPVTVSKFKTALKESLKIHFKDFDTALIDEAAVASNAHILNSESLINPSDEIALLPPVCGG